MYYTNLRRSARTSQPPEIYSEFALTIPSIVRRWNADDRVTYQEVIGGADEGKLSETMGEELSGMAAICVLS